MSNTRYIRILPSAVESKYGWKKYHVGAIYHIVDEAGKSDLVKEGTLRIALFKGQISSIEPHHVQEVYVYDEPRELPATEPYRIAELEARVKALEEKQEVTHRLASQAVLGSQPATYHEVKHDVEAQIGKTQPPRDLVKQESNLYKARRMYPKGTRFKSIGTVAHTIVSSGQFVQDDRGIYDKDESFYVNLGGAWAEIVQDDHAPHR